jgi:hypothetical protein
VEIVVANLPGWVLKNGLRETWGVVGGAWMQHDDQVEALGIQWILCGSLSNS